MTKATESIFDVQLILYTIAVLLVVILFIWILGSGCYSNEEEEVIPIEQVIKNHVGWLSQQDGVISVHSFKLEDGKEVIQIVFDKRFDSYLHLPVELDGYKIKVHLQ